MEPAAFLALLGDGPLLSDGGMGTALIDAGVPVGACFEALDLSDPRRVEAVHRGFVEAGARLVLTNTFGANRFRLGAHDLADRVESINEAGVERARAAGAELVGGSMGPLGIRLAPYGRVQPDQALAAYREQAAALAAAGADVLVIETQTDLRELEQAVLAAREGAPGLPVLASASFTRDDRTPLGSTPADVAARLVELEVDALGVNCGEGPAQALRVLRDMKPHAGGRPLIARPNAGGPAEVNGRFLYPATPAYVADLAVALRNEGAAIVGGCCGTGPGHTAAMASALLAPAEERAVEIAEPGRREEPRGPSAEAPHGGSGLRDALAEGRFVITVEMEPPRSFGAESLVAGAQTLRDAGADAIDVADSPMAKMRMSAWAACRLIQERAGIHTVLHFPTRGRNLLRLQGDLLGAHALGIRSLFVCVGDPVTIGDYPQAMNDVDVTATGLLSLITKDFNQGRDQAGSSIGEPTTFFAGAAVAPASADPEHEIRLLRRKVDAGAAFLLTQPVYDVVVLSRLRRGYEELAGGSLDVPVIAGVLPLQTARHATFLHNEVPGIVIPGSVRDRMSAATDAAREGVTLAAELIAELRDAGVAGIYVMPQFGRFDLAAEVVEAARG